jgi:hypothetical protein
MSGARRTIVRWATIAVALVIVVLAGMTTRGGAGSDLALITNTLNAVVDSTTPLTLALTTSDGVRLQPTSKSLTAGTYTVVVNDRSSTDNFHLIGLYVDQQTTNEFVGTVTWTVKFGPGDYAYRTDGAGAEFCGCGTRRLPEQRR